jgi:Putative zinc-finger
MEHDDAIRFRAAERYVGGELSSDERDDFEQHFFDCPECAEEVRWEQIFNANVRALAREEAAAPPKLGLRKIWWKWSGARPALAYSMAANALLAAGLGFVLMHGERQAEFAGTPRFLATYFAPTLARGSEQAQPIPAGVPSFEVHFPVPDHPFPSYSYQILNAAGKSESKASLSPPASGAHDLYLEVPVSRLSAGDHMLVVSDPSGRESVAQFQFRTTR